MASKFFKKLENDLIQCLACNHQCKIPEGNTGICGVRKNSGGRLELLVYGKTTGAAIDPIEKKPLYHLLPGTPIFSIGTVGCNFRCGFCQNWGISQNRIKNKELRIKDHKEDIKYWEPKNIIEHCLTNNIPSIAFTYNEPTIFIEYALEIIELAKKAKIKTVFVSNGYQSEKAINELVKSGLDAINIDLKSFSDDFYQRNCGAQLQPVLDNIKRFVGLGVWTEVTTLIIPDENDSDSEIRQIAEYIYSVSPDIPWHISRFHPDYLMTDRSVTSESILKQAFNLGRQAGLKYLYSGNINTNWGQDTVCPKCGTVLINRSGYQVQITDYFIDGKCSKCNLLIKGVWQ